MQKIIHTHTHHLFLNPISNQFFGHAAEMWHVDSSAAVFKHTQRSFQDCLDSDHLNKGEKKNLTRAGKIIGSELHLDPGHLGVELKVFSQLLWAQQLSGVHLKWREWLVSSSRGAERQLRASNELCSFTARLMETSGDLARSLSPSVCVLLSLSQRRAHSPAP